MSIDNRARFGHYYRMPKKPAKWITFTADKFIRDALEHHRKHLEKERNGQRVTASDAARDLISRGAAS